jgi:hypothetical protein
MLSDRVLYVENKSWCNHREQLALFHRKPKLATRLEWVLGTGKRKNLQRSKWYSNPHVSLHHVLFTFIGLVQGLTDNSEEVWKKRWWCLEPKSPKLEKQCNSLKMKERVKWKYASVSGGYLPCDGPWGLKSGGGFEGKVVLAELRETKVVELSKGESVVEGQGRRQISGGYQSQDGPESSVHRPSYEWLRTLETTPESYLAFGFSFVAETQAFSPKDIYR